jgi:hypothetical protein
MKLPRKVQEWWPLALITGILSAIGALLTAIYKDSVGPFVQHVLPAINNQTLLLLCLLQFLVCVLLVAWMIFLLRGDDGAKKWKNQYEFLPSRGFYKHKDSEGIICGKCFVSSIQAPLGKHNERNQK